MRLLSTRGRTPCGLQPSQAIFYVVIPVMLKLKCIRVRKLAMGSETLWANRRRRRHAPTLPASTRPPPPTSKKLHFMGRSSYFCNSFTPFQIFLTRTPRNTPTDSRAEDAHPPHTHKRAQQKSHCIKISTVSGLRDAYLTSQASHTIASQFGGLSAPCAAQSGAVEETRGVMK